MTVDRLETEIARWRTAVTRNAAVDAADADELEGHLREQVAELVDAGLTESEAFQIAIQRLGRVDQLTAEFAREHGERLWKQLALAAPGDEESTMRGRPVLEMIVFALIAAVVVQAGRLLAGIPETTPSWFFRDASLFVLPVLVAYFVWRNRPSRRAVLAIVAVTVVLAVIVTVYPFEPNGQTDALVAIHFPVLLWFVVGAAYLGGSRGSGRRMEFVRFTGEWVIYWVLLALGGGVLLGLTTLVLAPIASGAIDQVMLWVLPSGGAAAVIVAAWLVEAKKSVIENLAPVLTAVFTPLFAVMLAVVVVVYAVAGIGRNFDRDLVTVFDLLLLVVLGLVLYALSAREPTKPAGPLDAIRLVAVVAALVVDVLVLVSMIGRVAEFGFT
ncbi:MAG TPA: permease prefix domain 1-containing protein, partial [Lacisediminihabitans sp.]|uniref:permease prefix domain 1-containing protein n=1 Tax=Lacisediminihabitans sp. TaxID=2787631 RepID=UPI002ED947BA